MALEAFRHSTLGALCLAAATFGLAGPAAAAPSRAELEQRVIALEDELARVRGQVSGTQVPMQQRLDSIQAELVRVVGELEEARFMNSRLQNELRALRREIQLRDAEIAEELGLEPAFTATDDPFAPPTAVMPPARNPEGAPNDPNNGGGVLTLPEGFEQGAPAGANQPAQSASQGAASGFFNSQPYTPADGDAAAPAAPGEDGNLLPDTAPDALAAAKQFVLAGQFDTAETAFAEFQDRFGDSPQAGEALFWQGELQFARNSYSDARNSYIAALRADPSGSRAPDAFIQLAKTSYYLGAPEEACNVLTQFPQEFPNASAALRSKAESARQLASCR